MARKKAQTAKLIKVPTKYTIVDEDNNVRGTSNSYISAIDIANEIGLNITMEVTINDLINPGEEGQEEEDV